MPFFLDHLLANSSHHALEGTNHIHDGGAHSRTTAIHTSFIASGSNIITADHMCQSEGCRTAVANAQGVILAESDVDKNGNVITWDKDPNKIEFKKIDALRRREQNFDENHQKSIKF